MYKPRHRAPKALAPVDMIPSMARCVCSPGVTYVYCPQHSPAAYADHMARHATDTFGPFNTGEMR